MAKMKLKMINVFSISEQIFCNKGGPKVVGPFSLGYILKSFNHTKPKF